MPNIKSAKKRVEVIERKKTENKLVKSRLATAIKKFRATVATSVEDAQKMLPDVIALIDSAASKNVIHKNAADRKKARLNLLLDKAKQPKA